MRFFSRCLVLLRRVELAASRVDSARGRSDRPERGFGDSGKRPRPMGSAIERLVLNGRGDG